MANKKNNTTAIELAVLKTKLENLIEMEQKTEKKIDKISEAIDELKTFKTRISAQAKMSGKFWSAVAIVMSVVISGLGLLINYLRFVKGWR